MIEIPKSAGVKIIVLPPVSREDIIASEAVRAVKKGYRYAGHKPEDYPDNFAKRVSVRVGQIADELNISSSTLPNGQRMDKKALRNPVEE